MVITIADVIAFNAAVEDRLFPNMEKPIPDHVKESAQIGWGDILSLVKSGWIRCTFDNSKQLFSFQNRDGHTWEQPSNLMNRGLVEQLKKETW